MKRFKRVLLFGWVVIPPLRLKSFCVRTQIAKTGYLPAEYIPHTFWLVPPPPFAQVHRGGCYREKFFLFFSWLRSYLDLYSILQNICRFNSLQVFARHSSSVSFYIHHVWISRFQTLNFDSFLLVEFTRIKHCRFYALTLQLFISLTLLLIINKHLCLCEFGLCLF